MSRHPVFQRFRLLLLVALLALALPASAAPDKPVRVLILMLEGGATTVRYASDAQVTRMMIPLVGFAQMSASEKENERRAERLDKALAGFDKQTILYEAIVQAFALRSSMFEFERGTFRYDQFKNAEFLEDQFPEGYDFILVANEHFSGLTASGRFGSRDGSVRAMATLEGLVFDGSTRQRMHRFEGSATGAAEADLEVALDDPGAFVASYPAIAVSLASQLVGDLFRRDTLHDMAASVGRGHEIAAVSALFDKHARSFRFRIKPTEGWRRTRISYPYIEVVEPRGALNRQLGIRFEVDLIAPAFGHEVRDVEDYIEPMTRRLAASGIDVSTLAPFDGLAMPPEYRVFSYVIDPASDGRVILALRRVNDDLMELVNVVVTRDFETLYPQHRAAIEENISRVRLELRGR